jgi:hypothetical protein
MDETYLRLGRLIAGQCTPGFREARLEAEIDGSAADLRIGCTLADGRAVDEALRGAAIEEIHLCLLAIRDKMAEEDGRSWRSCTVTLIAGGGFRMDVAY